MNATINDSIVSRAGRWATPALCGLVLGYLLFDRSGQMRELRYQLAADESKLAESHGSLSSTRGRSEHAAAFHSHAHEPENASAPRPDITEADVNASLEMNDRASRGEYILKFERPVDRKVMECNIRAFAAQVGSNNAAKLTSLFGGLGLTSAQGEQLALHHQKIVLASLEVEQAIQQVLLARQEYDERARTMLSSEAYSQYRQFESSQPAVREYEALRGYASKNNLPLDPAYEGPVLQLIQQAQAYTRGWWHGPYDGLPPIGVGKDMVTGQLLEQISQIERTSTDLKQAASQQGLPPACLTLLDRYFSDAIQAKQKTVAAVNAH